MYNTYCNDFLHLNLTYYIIKQNHIFFNVIKKIRNDKNNNLRVKLDY